MLLGWSVALGLCKAAHLTTRSRNRSKAALHTLLVFDNAAHNHDDPKGKDFVKSRRMVIISLAPAEEIGTEIRKPTNGKVEWLEISFESRRIHE